MKTTKLYSHAIFQLYFHSTCLLKYANALSIASTTSISCAPHIGLSKKHGVNYYVIGTSHFRCQSANEVRALITDLRPDGVVIELDPERVIRLTLEDSQSSSLCDDASDKNKIESSWFGADFLAAIQTSQKFDIPLFVGDEYSQETKSRFIKTAFFAESYRPSPLLNYIFKQQNKQPSNYNFISSVNVFQTFLNDPWKLAPPTVTVSLPLFIILLTSLFTKQDSSLLFFDVNDWKEDLSVLLSLISSFFATCKVFNTLIFDRDDILAFNAKRAAKVLSSLKAKNSIRKRWTFTIPSSNYISEATTTTMSEQQQQQQTEQDEQQQQKSIPLFTLKTPLEQNAIRHLNLFEPRWLNMMDRLQQQSSLTQSTPDKLIVNQSNALGCISCTNKFYSAININGEEGRYADIIFKRQGRMAKVTETTEGQRPSGARKILVQIEGKEPFLVKEEDLSVAPEGYLIASKVEPMIDFASNRNSDMKIDEKKKRKKCINEGDDINIVVVVGLLHANGVLDRLSR